MIKKNINYENILNIRVIAAITVGKVLDYGNSLEKLLPPIKLFLSNRDSALLQELCFGIMRVLPQLKWLLSKLMTKELSGKKKRPLYYLLMIGIYQLIYTRIPPYAAISETVEGAIELKCPKLKSLINGVLRQFQRNQRTLLYEFDQQNQICHLHPIWLQRRIQEAWPEQYLQIINANNQRPPMWLRVNRLHHSRKSYMMLLYSANIFAEAHPYFPDAIKLNIPCNVEILPGFNKGWITVQDVSSQACAILLDPKNNDTILDLCAAPGGKTTHILEIAPKSQVIAVDINAQRAAQIYENLKRLNLQAKVVIKDGCTLDTWQNCPLFDRILLDVPCSATGVIRRHPDIKWLRQDNDIAELVKLQRKILCAAWRVLKPGGTLLYATCSILPEENRLQIANFLLSYPEARLQETGDTNIPGLQYLPSLNLGDGFFYAKMIKDI